VLHLLLGVLPLAAAASVSPMMLTEQTVLLAGPDGRRAARRYATGVVLVATVAVVVVLTLGRSLVLPRAPQLSASLDLVAGALLLVLAAIVHRRRPRRAPRPRTGPRRRMSGPRAVAFGMVSMATNVTSLALVVPAAKEIAASRLAVGWWLPPLLLLVAAATAPAWGPVALDAAVPRASARVLGALQRTIDRHGRTLVVVLLVGGAVYVLVRGTVRLATG
jgi:hypothetical protein